MHETLGRPLWQNSPSFSQQMVDLRMSDLEMRTLAKVVCCWFLMWWRVSQDVRLGVDSLKKGSNAWMFCSEGNCFLPAGDFFFFVPHWEHDLTGTVARWLHCVVIFAKKSNGHFVFACSRYSLNLLSRYIAVMFNLTLGTQKWCDHVHMLFWISFFSCSFG